MRRLLRRLWPLAAVCVASIAFAAGETGDEGISNRSSDGYRTYSWKNPDTPGSGTKYSGGVPTSNAFLDTLRVPRDLDRDGVIDSVGVGEYIPIQGGFVSYVGTGPDTLWIKMLNDAGESMATFRYVTGSCGTDACQRIWPILSWAPRLVYFAGRATSSDDEWLIHTGHE